MLTESKIHTFAGQSKLVYWHVTACGLPVWDLWTCLPLAPSGFDPVSLESVHNLKVESYVLFGGNF